MQQRELDLSEDMAQAIRDVVNFSRFDQKYQALVRLDRPNKARSDYFEERLGDIAEENAVDKEELRDWLKHYLRPESFGLEVRKDKDEEYVVRM